MVVITYRISSLCHFYHIVLFHYITWCFVLFSIMSFIKNCNKDDFDLYLYGKLFNNYINLFVTFVRKFYFYLCYLHSFFLSIVTLFYLYIIIPLHIIPFLLIRVWSPLYFTLFLWQWDESTKRYSLHHIYIFTIHFKNTNIQSWLFHQMIIYWQHLC